MSASAPAEAFAGPHWPQFVTTEHFTLATARAATIAEANGRTTLFVSVVAASLVAIGFIGQVSNLGMAFWTFVSLALPVLLFIGIVTFVRLVETAVEDVLYVRGMNRMRHLYVEAAPELAPYFVLSIYDDRAGTTESLGGSRPGWQQGLFSSAGLIEVIDSVVVGVGVWLAVEAAKPVPWLPVALGVLGFLASLVAHHTYQGRRFKRSREASPPMFPAPLPTMGRKPQTYVPVSSGWSGSP
jgi:hypothetical protein